MDVDSRINPGPGGVSSCIMPSKLFLIPSFFLLIFSPAVLADPLPTPDAIFRTLRRDHPRLVLDHSRILQLREFVRKDPIAKRLYAGIKASADKTLGTKPVVYELRDGRRLLYVSNDVLGRVRDLAFLHLMTGEKRYAERAWIELESAADFKDWNPSHFLDTAVLTKALAIGLDWLWESLTPAQRQKLRRSIVEKGLLPALNVYKNGGWWAKGTNNWNQVCNGGIGMGALAVAESDPELAGQILTYAIRSIPLSMTAYAPDGAGHEGPGYWGFGGLYNIMLISSLESALGTDFGLGRIDGFRQSGDYPIYLSGAGRRGFDFGDSNPTPTSAAQHLWMGKRYNTPRYTWFRHEALADPKTGGFWDLIWLDGTSSLTPPAAMPADKHFRKAEVVTMRDSWDAAGKGFAVALQGGNNAESHRHLDLGSFILDLDGQRWIIDTGKEPQTYHKHRHQIERENFYRVRAEGHNTLVFNPDGKPDQDPRARVAFHRFVSRPNDASVSLDLTPAYAKNATRVQRGFHLERGIAFTVTDQFTCARPAEIWSFFHTTADVHIAADGKSAILSQKGKRLGVRFREPTPAIFRLLPAEPLPTSPNPSMQTPNKGVKKLAVHLTAVTEASVSVRFERLLESEKKAR